MTVRLHENQTVRHAGAPLAEARTAVVLVHGRGATAEDILSLRHEFDFDSVAYLAPAALNNTWYPFSFLAPLEQNQPFLDSALRVLSLTLEEIAKAGIGREHMVLAGFSQGACLVLEFAARHAARYGGVIGLSGGIIGPDGTPREYPGSFDGTPVYLGCSDNDPHIPLARVRETANVFRRMGAEVSEEIFPGGGHTVFAEELSYFRNLLAALVA